MNDNIKNLMIGIIIIYIIYQMFFSKNSKENFTDGEMKKYPEMLQTNCKKSTEMYNKLNKINNTRCLAKGKTNRDTINNKRLCYDDIAKEIVAGLDAESNCVMSNLINKTNKVAKSEISTNSAKSNQQSQNLKPDEGPEFINTFFIPAYDSKKASAYSSYILDQPISSNHRYPTSSPYDNVMFTSDPSFLDRLSSYERNKTESINGLEYKSKN